MIVAMELVLSGLSPLSGDTNDLWGSRQWTFDGKTPGTRSAHGNLGGAKVSKREGGELTAVLGA